MRDDISKPCPAILDCTLRDGSYVVDFGFTQRDTAEFAQRLHRLGFPYIEVGHGIGLGASRCGMGVAAATDLEYIEAAVAYGGLADIGMFCIPGIASLEDVDLVASYKIDFLRIGCEVSQVESAKPFIERARHHGIYVFSNLMKSYAAPVDDFVAAALKCVKYGAECVYIVDSAGGMLPDDICDYACAFRDAAPHIKLGFHGHNNLGLGVANAMMCAGMGFDVIDTSLQGLGRSGGNVPAEQFIAALKRAGYDVPYDLVAVMQAGDDLVRQYVQPISSLDVAAGFAQFHSSYMPRILSVAKEKRVDPRRLILAVSARDKLNAPLSLIEECAAFLEGEQPSSALVTKPYYGQEQA